MTAALPALSVLFAVLATAVPWGLPADATFILPLVMVMMVFCWRALPGTVLPPYLAMLLGLLTDIVSGGPLGFWALMALISSTAGGRAPLTDGQDQNWLWLVWAGVAAVIASFAGCSPRSISFAGSTGGRSGSARWCIHRALPVVLRGLLWIRRGRLMSGPYLLRRWS